MFMDDALSRLRDQVTSRLEARGIAYEVEESGWILVLTGLEGHKQILITRRWSQEEGKRVPILVIRGKGADGRNGALVFWPEPGQGVDVEAAVNRAIKRVIKRGG